MERRVSPGLPSIYQCKDFRRSEVISEIKQRLESNFKLLLLGESGYSKTTLLMEVIRDYFDKKYKVHYSEGNEEPKGPETIAEFIRDLVREGNRHVNVRRYL